MFAGLVQLLLALVGAILISAAARRLKDEWKAPFHPQTEGAHACTLAYVMPGFVLPYNMSVHELPPSRIAVLAYPSALGATGFASFWTKRQSAQRRPRTATQESYQQHLISCWCQLLLSELACWP